jgi:integrase
MVAAPYRYGTFKKPSKKVLRRQRQQNGKRMFDADQIRRLLDGASPHLRAMILLGINCGFGNEDCGSLPLSAVDLRKGWIVYPRPKTGVERRCPLWRETVEALELSLQRRPSPRKEAEGRVFVTKYGGTYNKDTSANPISLEFRRLTKAVDEAAIEDAQNRGADEPPANITRAGLGFYGLRHTFETIGGGTRDQVAVDHIMGHEGDSMAAVYREDIDDVRLHDVVNHVHAWLFGHAEAEVGGAP